VVVDLKFAVEPDNVKDALASEADHGLQATEAKREQGYVSVTTAGSG
jgi:hypothetical protein